MEPYLFAPVFSLMLSTNISFGQAVSASGDSAIKELVTRFYEGWNDNDVEKMVSVYADSIDHVNAFGEWHTVKQTMKEDLTQFHAGPVNIAERPLPLRRYSLSHLTLQLLWYVM